MTTSAPRRAPALAPAPSAATERLFDEACRYVPGGTSRVHYYFRVAHGGAQGKYGGDPDLTACRLVRGVSVASLRPTPARS